MSRTKASRQTAVATKVKSKRKSVEPVDVKPQRKRKPVEQPVAEKPDATATLARYAVMDHVASGKATVGSVLSQFGMGFSGMRTVARQVRYGRFAIAGIEAESNPAGGDSRELAARLAKLKPSTAIKQLVAPPRRK